MIISTHQVHDLDSLIDSIIVMEKHEIVFNQTIENITKKLFFRVADRNEKDDSIIYSEDTLRGLYQVCENKTGEESKLDIELLFNAILTEKNRIATLFN